MARIIRMVAIVAVNFLVLLGLLFLMEGMSGYLYLAYQIVKKKPVAERTHTEYDEELGWVNLPNVYVEDMYGPGVYLATNSQRFRNQGDFGREVPDDRVRVVCSGDSFTLGYGVDNDHTWCRQLSTMDERLETINLGQGGYGVDQAYLWYRRNEGRLDHDIHIFAFITDDFRRMESDTFLGYPKPFLAIRNDQLHQENFPVSGRSYLSPRVIAVLMQLSHLRTVTALRWLTGQPTAAVEYIPSGESFERTRKVVSKIFAELQRANTLKQSVLILVYLPTSRDYMGMEATTHWRKFLKEEAEEKDYVFIDVVEALQSLPPTQIKYLFDGHYSNEGNEFVAELLLEKLRAHPRTSKLVDRGPEPSD